MKATGALVVLGVLTAVGVWLLTAREINWPAPRLRPLRSARSVRPVPSLRRRRIRFEEAFEVTVPDGPAVAPAPGAFTFAPLPDHRGPPLRVRLWGAIRLVFLIGFLAAAIAAGLWAAGHFVNQQIARFLQQ